MSCSPVNGEVAIAGVAKVSLDGPDEGDRWMFAKSRVRLTSLRYHALILASVSVRGRFTDQKNLSPKGFGRNNENAELAELDP